MALIKCPECNGKVSDTADRCPHCGFNVQSCLFNDNQEITQNVKRKKMGFGQIIRKAFSFDWIDSLYDKATDIPIIGNILGVLIMIIAIGVAFVAVFGGGFFILALLYEISPALMIIVALVGVNTFSYFACYKWDMRKKWFFWVCLFLTVGFACSLLQTF